MKNFCRLVLVGRGLTDQSVADPITQEYDPHALQFCTVFLPRVAAILGDDPSLA
jgi:hypothetical protein